MPEHELRQPDFDWRVTSFEGARREQLRRWARLPLEDVLLAIEEMHDVAQQWGATSPRKRKKFVSGASVQEPPVGYGESGAEPEG